MVVVIIIICILCNYIYYICHIWNFECCCGHCTKVL